MFNRRRRREIFQYWDGNKKSYGDPLAIANALDMDEHYRPDIHPVQSQVTTNDKQAAQAMIICLNAYRQAFLLSPFEPSTGKGLTDREVLALHSQYCEYIESLKKNISEPVMLPPSGDQPPMG
jgi:hypothetical protein